MAYSFLEILDALQQMQDSGKMLPRRRGDDEGGGKPPVGPYGNPNWVGGGNFTGMMPPDHIPRRTMNEIWGKNDDTSRSRLGPLSDIEYLHNRWFNPPKPAFDMNELFGPGSPKFQEWFNNIRGIRQ